VQHLIKVNLIVYGTAIAAGLVALLLAHVPLWEAFADATKVASVIQFISLGIIYFAWRWIPGFSYFIFPNLSGDWVGSIRFKDNKGDRTIEANLHVDQNVASISLVLTTDLAESETMVVYPRRLSNRRLELLYMYETHKKETLPPPSYRYRGTAVLRLEGKASKLAGSYYTEQGGMGTVTFDRRPGKRWFARNTQRAA
jgi:SMODS-associating 2TM, beta-strand rich effector domain